MADDNFAAAAAGGTAAGQKHSAYSVSTSLVFYHLVRVYIGIYRKAS